ncbi:NADP-dependent phosphogluconate dehydrogenase [Cytophagaceae bacterium ABcell3]|nr:NADP-dependent phosphogluconate dehydrogenase [Cytophagaceae bacterium ABcell3]
MKKTSAIGIIGMGTMGKSLALNLATKNIAVSIYNRHVAGKEEGIAQKVLEDNPELKVLSGFDNLANFVSSLESPRKILLMIPAGSAVDQQIEALIPHLSPGDLVIDGGNSFYKDSSRRFHMLAEKKINFIGAGISGGEEGARKGPSIMPGGSREGFELISPYLYKLSATDKNGMPCTAWIGPEGAGHFVKMIHNSIEYSEMQAIAEVYYLLNNYLEHTPEEIANTFGQWCKNGASGYLLEITVKILQKREGNTFLLDLILDQAEQKGTGSWSVNTALENGVPYGPLAEAVMARNLSAMKAQRVAASNIYTRQKKVLSSEKQAFSQLLFEAYQFTRVINHAVGFGLIHEVSKKNKWQVDLSEVARIWTNGCIIRSSFMEDLVTIFKESDELLLAPGLVPKVKMWEKSARASVAQGLSNGYPLPVMSAALNYFLGYITADSPANLTQAQRDYFGAHTYRRKDKPLDQYFHTLW